MMCCSAPEIQDINSILFEPNPNEVDITHFELHHLLGGGGFGVVQFATKVPSLYLICSDFLKLQLTDADQGTDYAIKSLSKASVLKRSTGFVSIYAELKILTLLNHPFICNAHYAFQDHCYLFLVLDLARAGDMRYNLSVLGGVFSEEMAKFYICQVILALEYCHMLRIIHSESLSRPLPLLTIHRRRYQAREHSPQRGWIHQTHRFRCFQIPFPTG
jgi:serine/threonine protein kinase